MAVTEGNDRLPEAKSGSETTKKAPRSRALRVRKHTVQNVNRNNLAQALDALYLSGDTVIGLNISRDIGGMYEVVSYKDKIEE